MSFLILSFTKNLYSFPTQNDDTPGYRALQFSRSSAFWMRYDLGIVDASVTTSPPDNVKIDRRLQTLIIAGGEVLVNPRFGLRANFQSEGEVRRQREESPPQAVTDSKSSRMYPSLDATFITDAGLEVFFGAAFLYIPVQKEESVSPTIKSSSTYSSAHLVSPRLGVVRRGGIWNGGMSYIFGREAHRKVSRIASDGSEIVGSDTIQDPTTIAVYGNVGSKLARIEFELASIQSGHGGNRTDLGTPVKEDHMRIQVGGLYMIGALGLRSSVAHQTLSYAHSAYVDVDSIPFTSIRAFVLTGSEFKNAFAGFIYGRGSDKQSIPEFNAMYRIEAFALSCGLNFGI